uniref:OTU deubiquitinase with linear linkage specificity a n=1 Tax=Cyprinus carpio carpio TaxID=630221 RepID=A0A9J7Y319_CYPCA
MSWVKSVASSENVFDEDVDDISLQNKEWKYNMEKRAKDGFRDGSDAGKEASLQAGFNMGYTEGATRMTIIGQLKGIMRHEDETKPQLGESVITKQPNAKAQILEPLSSYPTISLLHTEVPPAAEMNHNISPETAPTETINLAIEPPKTDSEITEEIQNIADKVSEASPDEALAENVASVKGEIEAQHRSVEEVDITAALTDDAGATATSSDSTVAPAMETPVKKAPVQEATALAQVESEKNCSQPEPETLVKMVVDEKEIIKTEELNLNDTNEVTHEVAGL